MFVMVDSFELAEREAPSLYFATAFIIMKSSKPIPSSLSGCEATLFIL